MREIWAMAPDSFRQFRALKLDTAGPVPEGAGEPRARKQKSVTILSLDGVLEPYTSLRGYVFGGTSTTAFGRAFDAAVEDDSVAAILTIGNSPGGSVFGTHELSDKIYKARGSKPLIFLSRFQADSAAYSVATAFDRIYMEPSSRVGSVGTMVTHQDWSKAYEEAGIKEYVIASDDAPFKGEWSDSQPVSQEYLDDLKAMVNEYQKPFVDTVARNRGVSVADVRSKFGKGRDVGAKYAIENGMADGVATLDEVLSKMVEGRMRIRRDATAKVQNLKVSHLQTKCS
jgi:signal peptide peptidase SppA